MSLLNSSLSALLRLDFFAALTAGVALLLLRYFLADLSRLPLWLVTAQAVTNLLYAAYDASLRRFSQPPVWRIGVLIGINIAYALVALGLLLYFYPRCSAFGVALFLAEVVFIGGIGIWEWLLLRKQQKT
jgi:hypothetical protein